MDELETKVEGYFRAILRMGRTVRFDEGDFYRRLGPNAGTWSMLLLIDGGGTRLHDAIVRALRAELSWPHNKHKETYFHGAALIESCVADLLPSVHSRRALVAAMSALLSIRPLARLEFASRPSIVREAALARWSRLASRARRVGRLALFVRRAFDEVHYRPGGRGQRRCREEFEELAGVRASAAAAADEATPL